MKLIFTLSSDSGENGEVFKMFECLETIVNDFMILKSLSSVLISCGVPQGSMLGPVLFALFLELER